MPKEGAWANMIVYFEDKTDAGIALDSSTSMAFKYICLGWTILVFFAGVIILNKLGAKKKRSDLKKHYH